MGIAQSARRNRLKRGAIRIVGVAGIVLALYCQGVPLHTAALRHPLGTGLCLLVGLLVALSPLGRYLAQTASGVFALRSRTFRWLLFGVALLLYLWVALDVFHAVPCLDDGASSLFQARIFSRFEVVLPLPEHAGFYEMFAVLGEQANLGHWCGMYPPGWPILLTLGVWTGVPWAVAPILGALLTLSIVSLGTELFDSRTGRVAGLLSLGSPYLLVLSGMHLSHIPTALFGTLCLLFLLRMRREAHWIYGLCAGLTWGMAFLCRPLTGAVLGAVFGAMLLLNPGRLWRHMASIVAAAFGIALSIMVYLLFQWAITGDPFLAGHVIGLGERGKYGFVRLDDARTHTIGIGATFTAWRVQALNDKIMGWPLPSLIMVGLPLVLGRRRMAYGLLLAPAVALLLVYWGYWYFEAYFPARYITAGVPFLLILCARVLVLMARRVRRAGPTAQRGLQGFIFGSVCFLLGVSTPDQFAPYGSRFGDIEAILPKIVHAQGITHAVVFMDSVGVADRFIDPTNIYYGTGFMRNDLDLRADVIYVRNSRGENIKILDIYPDRDYYLYRFIRPENRAYLYHMVLKDDDFVYVPVEPRTPLVVPPPPSF